MSPIAAMHAAYAITAALIVLLVATSLLRARRVRRALARQPGNRAA